MDYFLIALFQYDITAQVCVETLIYKDRFPALLNRSEANVLLVKIIKLLVKINI